MINGENTESKKKSEINVSPFYEFVLVRKKLNYFVTLLKQPLLIPKAPCNP